MTIQQRTPADLVLLSLCELQRLKMVEETPFDKRIVFAPPLVMYGRDKSVVSVPTTHSQRPIHLPESARLFVEDRVEHILAILFGVRVGTNIVSETDFLWEAALLIRCLAESEQGYLHADIVAAADPLLLEPLPLYVALAIYAKFVAIKLRCPPMLQREDIEQEVHFAYLRS